MNKRIEDLLTIKVFQEVRRKELEPNVYAIVVKSQTQQLYQHMDVHYRLEDAVEEAIRKADETLPGNIMWQVFMVKQLSVEELREKFIKGTVEVNKPTTAKSELMQRIVDTNDMKLYEDNVNQFTDEEKKLLLSELRKNAVPKM